MGSSNVEKWGDHQRKKFFINNSVETSRSIETTCTFGMGVGVENGEKMRDLQKTEFYLKQK